MYKCRLKVILAEKDMQQNDLLKKVDIGRGTLSQLVNNKTTPNFDTAYRIAETLDMKIEDIWVRVDDPAD
ncbi:helix-turn-helix domain-containing protein [Tuberibacillus sp. Marseille-P3662]|uniref:helix-turn-helix domain-containing protein n=1 Tax=Tuberibacillus sp. Marseille-P3662 TaxID=1965358 RepID=UPI000A1C9406|nr:helix-turn-helix transcriptional regulator [Tuberibacillus sp. Marseille-P3662]